MFIALKSLKGLHINAQGNALGRDRQVILALKGHHHACFALSGFKPASIVFLERCPRQ